MSLRTSSKPKDVVLLGSTGSIGTQAMDVVAAAPDRFRVIGLAAQGSRIAMLARQVAACGAGTVAVADPAAEDPLRRELVELGVHGVQIIAGPQAAATLAGCGADVVLNGITGAIGLQPTLAALAAGSRLALANKESLIIGGRLVTRAAAPGQMVPVDSEHSALAQCLRAGTAAEVSRLVVTASGGPFRGWSREQLHEVTAEQALRHPTWSMGPVITTNSATLVNKGLEVIEAHLLFDIPFDRIEVMVHPQSIVHSWVEFVDGSSIAQCSPPDMRLPIALALGWPERVPAAAPGLDLSKAMTWDFFPLDDDVFPAVRVARRVGRAGGTYPAVYNAANEVCVAAFLAGALRFTEIVDTVVQIVNRHESADLGETGTSGRGEQFKTTTDRAEICIDDVLAADSWAREAAQQVVTA